MSEDYQAPSGAGHPITPPPELVREWLNEFHAPCPAPGLAPGEAILHIATQAARWGYGQAIEELETFLEKGNDKC